MMPSRSATKRFLIALALSAVWYPALPSFQGDGQALAQSRPRDKPQNVFEVLFPDLYEQRLQRERALQQQQAPAPIAKIEAPKYFTYKTDRLVPVKLAALAKSPAVVLQSTNAQTAQNVQGTELIANVSSVLDGSAASPMAEGPDFELIAPQLAELSVLAEPEIAKAMVEHYAENRKLLWLDRDLKPTSAALEAIEVFSQAEKYGLDPSDYLVSLPQEGISQGQQNDAAARFEFTMTARAMRYALDAANGRVVPNRVSGYHDFPNRNLSAKDAIARIAAETPSLALPKLHPDNAPFKALMAELESLKTQSDDSISLPDDLLIKPGETSEHLAMIIKAIGKRASPELVAKFPTLLGTPVAETEPVVSEAVAPEAAAIETATIAVDPSAVATQPGLVPATEAVTGESLPPIAAEQNSPLVVAARSALAPALSAAALPSPVVSTQPIAANPQVTQQTVDPQTGQLPQQELAQQPVATVTAPLVYEGEIVELVKEFQKEAGLGPDGVIGRNTIGRLVGTSLETKRERVVIALEQLRWHPRELGSRHVFINQPAFRARYVEGGTTRLDMRVVVGTKANQTNFFHDMVETVEYNPYWGVPQSILVNEYLPKLRENPGYLDERGYEVTDNNGNRIPSSAINWYSFSNSVPYNVRQSPGEANALGELKILFPNKHAIYMHDTPARALFKKDFRAFSHGCVRLAEPRLMAAAVLGKDVAHVEAMLSKGHGQDELSQKFPVYVAYFTAWPDDNGTVEYFADMYGRDDAMKKAFAAVSAERGPAG